MKVLNLSCAHGHAFEGWFGSDEDFLDQSGRGLVECPLCGDSSISRLPTAPRLNVSNLRESAPAPAAPPAESSREAMWLRAVRHVMQNTEDVGERFAEEARRIHYGEVESRGIRGQASPEDAQALQDEGIEVMTLPVPVALKRPLQ